MSVSATSRSRLTSDAIASTVPVHSLIDIDPP
jgi:hypothetical protein